MPTSAKKSGGIDSYVIFNGRQKYAKKVENQNFYIYKKQEPSLSERLLNIFNVYDYLLNCSNIHLP